MSTPARAPAAPRVDPDHPWLGLESFTRATRAYFFGRDAEIDDIAQRIHEHTLTILYGQSGYGKSSLLGAGLVPRLEEHGFHPELFEFDFDKDAPPLLEQAHAALAKALDAPAGGEALTLWEFLHHIPSRPPCLAERRPVLIIDQFEELFT